MVATCRAQMLVAGTTAVTWQQYRCLAFHQQQTHAHLGLAQHYEAHQTRHRHTVDPFLRSKAACGHHVHCMPHQEPLHPLVAPEADALSTSKHTVLGSRAGCSPSPMYTLPAALAAIAARLPCSREVIQVPPHAEMMSTFTYAGIKPPQVKSEPAAPPTLPVWPPRP